MDWQEIVVALVVLGALAYLASRFLPRRPKRTARPDVAVGSLVRRDRTRPS